MTGAKARISSLLARMGELAPLFFLMLAAALLVAFAKISDEMMEQETAAFDRYFLLAFRSAGDPNSPGGPAWLPEVARDVTSLGSVTVLAFVVLSVAVYLLLEGRWTAAVFVAVSICGGQALSTLLKGFFERPRPDLVPHAVHVATASFPSGHAMLSAVTYLTLGALLTNVLARRATRIYVVVLAVLLTVAVGLSRIYLGVHWPTDVLAGWCVGSAWAIFCWMVMWWVQRRTQSRPDPAA